MNRSLWWVLALAALLSLALHLVAASPTSPAAGGEARLLGWARVAAEHPVRTLVGELLLGWAFLGRSPAPDDPEVKGTPTDHRRSSSDPL